MDDHKDSFAIGLDVVVEDSVLKHNHRELAVWAAFEGSRYKISPVAAK